MKIRILIGSLLVVFPLLSTYSQTGRISGFVYDSTTREGLPYANIYIPYSGKGTATNAEGVFTLLASGDTCTLIISYVGYRTETIAVTLTANPTVHIGLTPVAILFPEVIVVAGEDPAIGLIRKAIAAKRELRASFHSLRYNAYEKESLAETDAVLFVKESFVQGFYQRDSLEKTFVRSAHRTENLERVKSNMTPPIITVSYLDFFQEVMMVANNEVVLPLADNTFDLYDFKLRTVRGGDHGPLVYDIEVIPLSELQPLFRGIIQLDGTSYQLTGVQLTGNKSIRYQYLDELSVVIDQRSVKNGEYWLPRFTEITVNFHVNVSGLLSLEPMSHKRSMTVDSYEINAALSDSVRRAKRSVYGGYTMDISNPVQLPKRRNARRSAPVTEQNLFEPSTAPIEMTQAEIDSLRPLPLTLNERTALATLDSLMHVDKLIKPKGVLADMVDKAPPSPPSLLRRSFDTFLQHVDVGVSRIEGLRLDAHTDLSLHGLGITATPKLSYATGLTKLAWSLSAGIDIVESSTQLAFHVFDDVIPWSEQAPYLRIVNSVAAVLGIEDIHNYMRSSGFRVSLSQEFAEAGRASLGYHSSRAKALTTIVSHRIFSLGKNARPNPAVLSGQDNRIDIDLSYGAEFYPLPTRTSFGVYVHGAISAATLGSDFDYRSGSLGFQSTIKTFFPRLNDGPSMRVRLEYFTLTGKTGPQHAAFVSTALGPYAPFGAFKLLRPYEFRSTRHASMHLEHDWSTIPFQLLGITFLESSGVRLTTGVSIVGGNKKEWDFQRESDLRYLEASVGISRILSVLSVSFTRSSEKMSTVTFSISPP